MSKRRTQINFDPGIRKGVRTKTLQAVSQRIGPPGPPQTFTYNNQVAGVHDPSGPVKVPIVGGWRRPAPYRVFAARAEHNSFSYNYMLSASTWSSQGTTDTAGAFGPPSWVTFWGTKLSGGLRVPDVGTSLLNQAISEAKNKLQNQDLNLLTSLAELRETVSFIMSLLRAQDQLLRKFIYAVRDQINDDPADFVDVMAQIYKNRDTRRKAADVWYGWKNSGKKHYSSNSYWHDRYTDARSKLDALTSLWLTTQFGLYPLVSDIQAAAVALKEKLAKPGAHVSVLRSITSEGSVPPNPGSYAIWKASGYLKYGAECQLNYRVNDVQLGFIAALGLLNPLGVFWEVTPYSFVVDWLIPVGSWLASLTADVGLVFESGFTNVKSFSNITYTTCKQNGVGKLPSVTVQNVCQKRDSLVTTPLPGLYISYKSPFSTSHLISATALVDMFARRVRV